MRQPPFTGRDEELKALQLELTLAKTFGRVALVVGKPGIGKSRHRPRRPCGGPRAHIYAKLGLRNRRDLALQDLVPTGGS